MFPKNFCKNCDLDDSSISLPVLHSRTNLKLHNISVTPKMLKKVIANLDSSKASVPDCIPVVFLKNCGHEHSYILAELFNMCLKESCFPDCWKISLVVPVFKNVGERPTAKNYCPVSLLCVVSKAFDKLVNNRIVDHLGKCGVFSDFQYSFKSSWSTADLLCKLNLYLISGQIFGLISSFFNNSFKWLQDSFKAPLVVLHFSFYTSITFLMILSVILLSMLVILLSTLSVIRHLICGNNCNWLPNLNVIYETLWTGAGSGLLISILKKLHWFFWPVK